ncbi:MAG: cupin domain-containing protein [Deltaproteobacteria bacterium]|nr:MAG: cupin domain-containing protein [Deltaproteobacteria bacterium]
MAKAAFKPQRAMYSKVFTYDYWMESTGIPIRRGYYVEDLRKLELGWWEERGCMSAFIQLAGQEGVSAARVTEIPAGKTIPPLKFALDEVVYVAQGRGLTTIWYDNGGPRKSFEWQQHSMFLLPHGCHHQFSNMQGDRPARLLHYSYLPLGMSAIPDPDFFFNNSHPTLVNLSEEELYSEAKMIQQSAESNPYGRTVFWYGNFFPDMRAWDKLDSNARRGAGGRSVSIMFPNSEVFAHMSVFGAQTYKKAHRHGPGRVIVIPAGEGYSIMWEEGKEKVVVPWHECSMFVPPNRWFHQHFNVGGSGARYLALHSPMQFYGHAEKVEDRAKDQIEYPDEDPWIRRKFEEELAQKGLKSLMPDEAYTNRDYEWSRAMGKR